MVSIFKTEEAEGEPCASRVLCRALKLLELIARSRQGLRVVEIEHVVPLHRSSIYRYLNTFVSTRYLEKDKEGRYRLGPKVMELAGLALENLDIREVAHPLLIELSEAMDATVHLCRLDGTEVIYLDKVETHRSLPLYSRIGSRAPAYCTGVGKALLAFLPPERLKRTLARTRFRRFTANTIIGREELLAELSAVRERGYAVDRGEHEEGIYCVAAPIFDLYGEPIASISITDLARKIEGNEECYAREVLRVAQAISRSLGEGKEDGQE